MTVAGQSTIKTTFSHSPCRLHAVLMKDSEEGRILIITWREHNIARELSDPSCISTLFCSFLARASNDAVDVREELYALNTLRQATRFSTIASFLRMFFLVAVESRFTTQTLLLLSLIEINQSIQLIQSIQIFCRTPTGTHDDKIVVN